MPYLLAIAIIGIGIVLGLFTVWGGILFVVAAAIVGAVIFFASARETTVERAATDPTGTPRAAHGGAETANDRVGT